jgi:hypothetical protein
MESPMESPIESSRAAPKKILQKSPDESPKEIPKQIPKEKPKETPKEKPKGFERGFRNFEVDENGCIIGSPKRQPKAQPKAQPKSKVKAQPKAQPKRNTPAKQKQKPWNELEPLDPRKVALHQEFVLAMLEKEKEKEKALSYVKSQGIVSPSTTATKVAIVSHSTKVVVKPEAHKFLVEIEKAAEFQREPEAHKFLVEIEKAAEFQREPYWKNCLVFAKGLILNIFGLEFKFHGSSYKLHRDNYEPTELVSISEDLFQALHSINRKGFVTDSYFEDTFLVHISNHMASFGLKTHFLGNSELTYTMWWNFLFVNLYYLVEKSLATVKETTMEENGQAIIVKTLKDYHVNLGPEVESELYFELLTVRDKLRSRLEQYVKAQFQKRGITIIQNTYTGFDSEYETLNAKKSLNKLLSVQTAVQKRTLVKVPLYAPYDISYVHPLTSQISDIYKNKVDVKDPYKYEFRIDPCSSKSKPESFNELLFLNNCMKISIDRTKQFLLGPILDANSSIIKKMKLIKDVKFFEDFTRDQIVFLLPLTPLSTNFITPGDEGFSFENLLEVSQGKDEENSFDALFDSPSSGAITTTTTEARSLSLSLSISHCICLALTKYSKYSNGIFENRNRNRNFDSVDLQGTLPIIVRKIDCRLGGDPRAISTHLALDSGRQAGSHSPHSPHSHSHTLTHSPSPSPSPSDRRAGTQATVAVTQKLENTKSLKGNTFVKDKATGKEVSSPITREPAFGNSLKEDFVALIRLFSISCSADSVFVNDPIQKLQWYERTKTKARACSKLAFNNEARIYLSVVRNNYIIAHYNAADLPMLKDFDDLKKNLSVVNKSFVSLGKPLRFNHTFVYIRDTILLAPTGKSSLAELGRLYESDGDRESSKIKISDQDINNMGDFLKRDRGAFEDYAIRDAIIALKHGICMEEFNSNLKQIGVPLTLSSLGRKFVAEEWGMNFDKHLPYQISGEYLMGDPNQIFTPKGIFATRDVGAHMTYFIANYKGGRNESFMYGADHQTHWYDYDLTSAYTTAMADLTLPDYYDAQIIKQEELDKWKPEQLLRGYLIVNCDFEFPRKVKFPSIPCYADKNTTVYPLKGTAFLTGPEFLLAKGQGCKFKVKNAFFIFNKGKWNSETEKMEDIFPFKGIIQNIQALRRSYPKGTINNLLYKEMGNSMYGNIVRGMSDKKSYDAITGKSFRISATELSNPILASWTTAFIRSVIGECLHNIQKLGGRVVSVTTDGFITDLVDLEKQMLEKLPLDSTILLRKYRGLRYKLAGDSTALELKTEGKGVLSWTTRGQMGIEGKMIAATGFQRTGYEKNELISLFKDILKAPNKRFEFTRKSLRGAKDILDKGGHVQAVMKDQTFRLLHDNRRKLLEPQSFKFCDFYDFSGTLLDSEPLNDVNHCKTLRFVSKFPVTLPFNKNNTNRAVTGYKNNLEIGVRNFIKAYYSSNCKFGLRGNEFLNVNDLIAFIYAEKATKDIKITRQSVSKLKNRTIIWRPVPRTKENSEFCNYVKTHLPHFRDDLFLKN